MAVVGNIPVPVVSTTPVLITGQLLGNTMDNQRWMLWRVKNAWIAKGWHVVQSYSANGVIPAPGVDTWVSYTDLKGTGGGGTFYSWIVLGNSINTRQICINVNVAGNTTQWLEIALLLDPQGAFAGGTTSARPTSATEIVVTIQSASPFGTGPLGNPQFYAVVWVAADLSYTRVAWIYAGHCKQIWQFDELTAVPAGWTNNTLAMCSDWANTDYTVVGRRMTVATYETIFGSGGFAKYILTPGPNTVTSVEGALYASPGGQVTVENPIANGFSNQYFWLEPMGISKRLGAASVNGFWGYNKDQWWIADLPFNDGDTMGDNFDFIIIGQSVLQWGLGAIGTSLGGASTNYPTARWYGRAGAGSICTCGPDNCSTPTTPLITLRNGAKELADKVNDASVSDITWNVWINQGVESLWSLVSTAFADHFFKTFDFTLAGGVGGNILDVSTVPTTATGDFRRVRMIEWNPDTSSRLKIRSFNWNEKDARKGAPASTIWCSFRRYRLMGQKLYVEPYEQSAGPYRLYYIPGPQTLTLTCDALDPAVDEWAEYPMVFAAMKALGKEESDDSQLSNRIQALKAEILDAAASRNDGDADTIADVEGGGNNGGSWG